MYIIKKTTQRPLKKRVGAIFFAVTLLLSLLSFFSFTPPVKANAATSLKVEDALNWARGEIGGFIDLDGNYGSQCVDLIRGYYRDFFGKNIDNVSGNADAYYYNTVPTGFTRYALDNVPGGIQPGDIFIDVITAPYGHVGIIESVTDNSHFVSIDANVKDYPGQPYNDTDKYGNPLNYRAVKSVSHGTANKPYIIWGVIRYNDFEDYVPNPYFTDKEIDLLRPLFDTNMYAEANPDVKNAFSTSEEYFQHFLNYAANEPARFTNGRFSKVIDPVYYLKNNKDISDAYGSQGYLDALKHILNHGIAEGRQTAEDFSFYDYKSRYPDLQIAFGNNNMEYYKHYINYGSAEGRNPQSETAPAKPVFIDINAWTSDSPATFSWTPVENATDYQVLIWDTSVTPQTFIVNTKTTETTYHSYFLNGSYAINVRANNSAGVTPSDDKEFLVQTPPTSSHIPSGDYKIIDTNSGKTLSSGGASVGGDIVICTDNNDGDELFNLQEQTNGTYTIKAVKSGLYLGVEDSNISQGANVEQQNFSYSGDPVQNWYIYEYSDGNYQIRNAYTGRVFDIANASTEDLTGVKLGSYHGGQNQRFSLEYIAPVPGKPVFTDISSWSADSPCTFTWSSIEHATEYQVLIWDINVTPQTFIVNTKIKSTTFNTTLPNGNYAINVRAVNLTGATPSNDTGFIVQTPEPSAEIPAGNYKIIDTNSGKTLSYSQKQSGENIVINTDNNDDSGIFYLNPQTDGTYTIHPADSDLYLGIEDTYIYQGANLEQQTFTQKLYQSWYIYYENGTYQIRNAYTGKVFEVMNGGTSDFTAVKLMSYHGKQYQRFSFVPVDETLTTANITLSETEYTYDGTEHRPTVTVKNANGETLVEGTDYTLTLPTQSTLAGGMYIIKVTGTGRYTDEVDVFYQINQDSPFLADTKYYGGNKYELYLMTNQTLESITAFAAEKGGHMSVISDYEENAFIKSFAESYSDVLNLGLTRESLDSADWYWSTGELATVYDWSRGEPNIYSQASAGISFNQETFGVYAEKDSKWNGKWGTFTNPELFNTFIIEYENGIPSDGSLPSDGTIPSDGQIPSDGGLPSDGQIPSDGSLPSDGTVPSDGSLPSDGGLPSDGTINSDGSIKKTLSAYNWLKKIILFFDPDDLTDEQKKTADVKKDGLLNVFDLAVYKKQWLAESTTVSL
jgi:hypothetical protein